MSTAYFVHVQARQMQESSCIVGVGNGKSVLTLFRLPEYPLGVRGTTDLEAGGNGPPRN